MELEENGSLPFLGMDQYNQECMPAGHEGVQEANGHWASVKLPQPRGR